MRTRTRRLVVGTAAGLALALATPLVPAAEAHGRGGPEHGRHGWHSTSNPAEWTARKTLKAALKSARATLHVAVRTARTAFNQDPIVVQARADLLAVVTTATDPGLITTAWDAYNLAVAGPAATRDAALSSAVAAYETAVETAYVAYDTATTSSDEAAARATYRASVRTAVVAFRTSVKTANTTFRTATAPAKATLRAAVNAASATFQASAKTDADILAFKTAVAAARETYENDPVVVAAAAARRTALHDARTAYRSALKAAKDAFFAATGHNPMRLRILVPRV